MHLPIHLHLLIPSSTPSIKLETRIYLPSKSHTISNDQIDLKCFSMRSTSTPSSIEDLPEEIRNILREINIERVVVAVHPWGRLGGNMLDPVLSVHLVNAILNTDSSKMKTAVVTFNTRGVGLSNGSLPFPGTIGYDALDFEEIEIRSIELLGTSVTLVDRVGYSWGCLTASLAPTSTSTSTLKPRSILMIAPPILLTPILSLLKSPFSPTFNQSIRNHINQGVKITLVHGTIDQFTSVERFRSFTNGYREENIERVEIDGADHFFRGEMGDRLQDVIRQWSEGL